MLPTENPRRAALARVVDDALIKLLHPPLREALAVALAAGDSPEILLARVRHIAGPTSIVYLGAQAYLERHAQEVTRALREPDEDDNPGINLRTIAPRRE